MHSTDHHVMPTLELFIYFFTWSCAIFYSCYKLALASKSYLYLIDADDLSHDDSWIDSWAQNHPQDVSDIEWKYMRYMFLHYGWYWILIHVIMTRCLSLHQSRYFPLYLSLISSIIIIHILTLPSFIVIILIMSIYFLTHFTGHKLLCYSIFPILLYMIYTNGFKHLKRLCQLNEMQGFLLEVSLAWLSAKCLSFSIDRIRSEDHRKNCSPKDMINLISYCLYFPAFFTGPIYDFNTYLNNIKDLQTSKSQLFPIKSLVKQVGRYMLWAILLEILSRFLYASSIQFSPEIYEKLDTWTMCGLGFSLPLIFFLKYQVLYGLAGSIAAFDKIEMPGPPWCIARIHSCGLLWRHFDRGLHLWLLKYFYKPLASTWSIPRKIFAGFVSFTCICLWHGMDSAIIAWGCFNFALVSAEQIGNHIDSMPAWKRRMANLTPDNELRLRTLIATPFYAVAFSSNVFFLSNWDLGWTFMSRIFTSFPIPILPTLMIMYAGAHVSIYCLKQERSEKIKAIANNLLTNETQLNTRIAYLKQTNF